MSLDPKVYNPALSLGAQLAQSNLVFATAASGPTGVTGPTGPTGPTGAGP